MEATDDDSLPTIETILGKFSECGQKILGLDCDYTLSLIRDFLEQRHTLGTCLMRPDQPIQAHHGRPGHAAKFSNERASPFASPGRTKEPLSFCRALSGLDFCVDAAEFLDVQRQNNSAGCQSEGLR
jgi:hypothetical protein